MQSEISVAHPRKLHFLNLFLQAASIKKSLRPDWSETLSNYKIEHFGGDTLVFPRVRSKLMRNSS